MMAAKVEEVVDPVVGGKETLRLPRALVHVWTAPWVQGVCCMI